MEWAAVDKLGPLSTPSTAVAESQGTYQTRHFLINLNYAGREGKDEKTIHPLDLHTLLYLPGTNKWRVFFRDSLTNRLFRAKCRNTATFPPLVSGAHSLNMSKSLTTTVALSKSPDSANFCATVPKTLRRLVCLGTVMFEE